MKMKKLALVLIPIIGGGLVGKLTTPNAKSDYENFEQPPLAPPKEAFGIVWPVLYLAMGIARSLIRDNRQNRSATTAYRVQLALNYAWSLLYFKYQLRGTALIESFALLSFATITALKFYENNKTAGLLLLPYILWLSFACYLNGATNWLNKENADFSNDF